jgi:hypothetical protein
MHARFSSSEEARRWCKALITRSIQGRELTRLSESGGVACPSLGTTCRYVDFGRPTVVPVHFLFKAVGIYALVFDSGQKHVHWVCYREALGTQILTNGKVTEGKVAPHGDLIEFGHRITSED